jgi:hypothetical protein
MLRFPEDMKDVLIIRKGRRPGQRADFLKIFIKYGYPYSKALKFIFRAFCFEGGTAFAVPGKAKAFDVFNNILMMAGHKGERLCKNV